MDWSLYPNFKKSEFVCSETKECNMDPEFLEVLQSIRNVYDKPMVIASGFRSVKHSVEVVKPQRGEHTYGCAVDIKVHGADALTLIHHALTFGITRIGVSQKGDMDKRFIHLGMGDSFHHGFPPGIWSY